MRVIVAVSLIIQIVSGARIQGSIALPGPDICGGDVVGHRIVSGNNQVIGSEFPWLVVVQYRPPNGGDLLTPCVGSLINQRYVLTAAHCVTAYDMGRPVSVRLGDNSTRVGAEFVILDIEEIYVHEDFTRSNFLKDIALIRLKSEVSYSKNIKPICLPSTVGQLRLREGHPLTVAGWGLLNDVPSTNRQYERVTYLDNDQCRARYSQVDIVVDPSHICADHSRDTRCISDGGGPLMAYHNGVCVLHGIMAFGGRPCGVKNLPDVFTNVGEYDQWIKKHMWP
ncbi:CLIP domain-containing serine protease 14D-like [Drosophila rhopaloa]|uniref:Serine protease easter-like n=1 Tax=Drosophila rhopaloa TaxID=1041015 RepID=A0A6P4E318_DRORH|nr:CLIP domain-containing serine protease 14D-like [Drosophila rhopaloa]